MSRLTGFVFVWSTPAVLRIEGLSRWGLNAGALTAADGVSWASKLSAARAVKKPTGGSCVAEESDELETSGASFNWGTGDWPGCLGWGPAGTNAGGYDCFEILSLSQGILRGGPASAGLKLEFDVFRLLAWGFVIPSFRGTRGGGGGGLEAPSFLRGSWREPATASKITPSGSSPSGTAKSTSSKSSLPNSSSWDSKRLKAGPCLCGSCSGPGLPCSRLTGA